MQSSLIETKSNLKRTKIELNAKLKTKRIIGIYPIFNLYKFIYLF